MALLDSTFNILENKDLSKIEELLDDKNWAHALYLHERSNIETPSLSCNAEAVEDWLKRFGNNKELLIERLKQDGMTYSEFLHIISNKENFGEYAHMNWFASLKEIFLIGEDTLFEGESDNYYPKDMPFVSFCVPFVKYAKSVILKKLHKKEVLDVIDTLCIEKVITSLICSVVFKYSAKTLIFELNKDRIQNKLIGNTPEERYKYFENKRISTKLKILELLLQYPVLARLIVESTNNTIINFVGLIKRFLTDKSEIESTFNIKTNKIVSLQALGDSHNGGQHVFKFDFNSGSSVIYKPRSLAIDLHFQKLLEWINGKGIKQPFKTIKVIDKGLYGWQEFVPYIECSSSDEISRFYERQGQYLCILHLLNATDLHYENLVANGEHPVLIDLESLFHTTLNFKQSFQTSSTEKAINILSNSVARTSLLPVFADESLFDTDFSGLGGGKRQKLERYKLVNVKTDEMKLVKGTVFTQSGKNLPKYDGKIYDAVEYIDRIKEGFRRTYYLIKNNLHELLSQNSPLHLFRRDKVRIILRNTTVYSTLLDASTHPKYLKSGIERVKLFDYMWALGNQFPERVNAIIYECKDLLAGDIPYFYVTVDSTEVLNHQGSPIKGLITKDSFNLVLKKIKSMSIEDCNRQIDFIEKSLLTKFHIDVTNIKKSISKKVREEDVFLDKNEFLNEAMRIANTLEQEAIWGDKSQDVTWIGMGMSSDERLQYKAMDMGIYNGVLGMSMFFAHVGKESKIKKFDNIAKACLQTALKERMITKSAYISAFFGYGSAIYVLTHLYKLWKEEYLLDEARQLIDEIELYVAKDKNFDLLSGSAGTILVLLNFYDLTGYKKALDIAIECGHHLIKNSIKMQTGVAWSISSNHTPLSGISHGTAGIALALMRLAKNTGDQVFLNIAIKAIEYENSTFDKEEDNWLDLRAINDQHKAKSVVHWCNGAPGIGIARLRMLDYYPLDSMYDDLDKAINITINKGFQSINYSLCHGDLGNLELLLLAAKKQDKYKSLIPFVYKKASNIVKHVIEDNYNWKCGIPGGQQTPNFMVGLAGIGYELLRLYNNDLPSVLALE
jgi:type 2 lantibiotic biosynthesis protein LanM